MEIDRLQAIVNILHRVNAPEVQDSLSESPLTPLAAHDSRHFVEWIHRPVQLALQYGLDPLADAYGADSGDLLAFIHPRCQNATACFDRLTMLRPDRVWGGECIYICRTTRPISLRWHGPDPLELILVEGHVEMNQKAFHAGHGTSTLEVPSGTACFVMHPTTLIAQQSWITRLVDHADAAGIPICLPHSGRSNHPVNQPKSVVSPYSRNLLGLNQPLRSPKM